MLGHESGNDRRQRLHQWLQGIATQVAAQHKVNSDASAPELVKLKATAGIVQGRASLCLGTTALGDFHARVLGVESYAYALHFMATSLLRAVCKYEQPALGPIPWPVLGKALNMISEEVQIVPSNDGYPVWSRAYEWNGHQPSTGHLHSGTLTGVATGRVWHILLDSCLGLAAARPPRLVSVAHDSDIGFPASLNIALSDIFQDVDYDMILAGLNSSGSGVQDGALAPEPRSAAIRWRLPDLDDKFTLVRAARIDLLSRNQHRSGFAIHV